MRKLQLLLLLAVPFIIISCKKEENNYSIIDFKDLHLERGDTIWGKINQNKSYFKSDIATFFNEGIEYSGVWYYSGFFYSNKNNFRDNKKDYQENIGSMPDEYLYTSSVNKGIDNNIYLVYNNLNNQNDTNNSIRFDIPVFLRRIYITNNAYSYCSMKYGDNFAKMFTKDDWFKVAIIAFDDDNIKIGENELFLAKNGNIIDTWRKFDLNFERKVKFINIKFHSSDEGPYGINTPSYFCIGKIEYQN